MNVVETFANASAEAPSVEKAQKPAPQEIADITPLSLDTFKLIGGGTGIVVL